MCYIFNRLYATFLKSLLDYKNIKQFSNYDYLNKLLNKDVVMKLFVANLF